MPLGRNDPCPCGSGKKYKACHSDQLGALRRILVEKSHAAVVVHGERLRHCATLLSEEEDALHRMVEANAVLTLVSTCSMSSAPVDLGVARVAAKHLAVWLWENGNVEYAGIKLDVSDSSVSVSVLSPDGSIKTMDLTEPPPQWTKRSGRLRGPVARAPEVSPPRVRAPASVARSGTPTNKDVVRGLMSAVVALMVNRNFSLLSKDKMAPAFARYIRKWFRDESPEVRAAVDSLIEDGLADRFCAAMDAGSNEAADAEMEKLSSIKGLSKRFLDAVEREAAARFT